MVDFRQADPDDEIKLLLSSEDIARLSDQTFPY